MRYVLAILLPPSMALAYGGCGSFTLNIILCLVGYIPGMVHAILFVLQKESNDRHQAMMKEMVKWQAHQDLKRNSRRKTEIVCRKKEDNVTASGDKASCY